MKFLHISDLHIGKRVNEFSMTEDQKYILNQILRIAEQERAEAVLIAGDVYDKSMPSAEAVQIFDWFLTGLADLGKTVIAVSGNHDSPERIAFGGELMRGRGVYVSPVYQGEALEVALRDEYGDISVHLLPFLKPATLRHALEGRQEEEENRLPESYQEALEIAVKRMEIDVKKRNILVAHQFVTGAGRCDSEEVSVGGLDNVDASVFDDFDYVALGHIHKPQVIAPRIRYSGSPLKYSFGSEERQEKGVVLVDTETMEQTFLPIQAPHDHISLQDTYENILRRTDLAEHYLSLEVTDRYAGLELLADLQERFPYLLSVRGKALTETGEAAPLAVEELERLDETDIMRRFLAENFQYEPTPEQLALFQEVLVWSGEEEEG